MRGAFLVAMVLPVLGGAGVLALREATRSARLLVATVGLGSGAAGVVLLGVRVWTAGEQTQASFRADPWTVILAGGVLAACLALIDRPAEEQVALLAAAGAAIGSVFSVDVVGAAAFLVATTIGLGIAAVLRGDGRWPAWLAAADLLAMIGLVWAAGQGMRVPPHPQRGAALLLLVAGAVRLLGRAPESAIARAQGFLLIGWALAGLRDIDAAVAIVAAAVGAALAHRAWSAADRGAAAGAASMIAVAGLFLPGAPAAWSAALLIAAVLATASPRVPGSAAALAALPGLTGVAAAGFADVGDVARLAVGLLALAAAAWLTMGALTAPSRGAGIPVAAGLAIAAAAAVVFFPGTALTEIGSHAGPAVGAGRPLAAATPAIPDEAGIVFAVAVIGVSLIVRTRRAPIRHAGTVAERSAVDLRPARAALLIGGAAVGWLLALFAIGTQRGFL